MVVSGSLTITNQVCPLLGMVDFNDALITLKRVEEFLNLANGKFGRKSGKSYKAHVSLNKCTLVYGYEKTEKVILENVSLEAKSGQLTVVIGPVGSGKSTLLDAILGEVDVQGEISVNGKIAYVSQDSW